MASCRGQYREVMSRSDATAPRLEGIEAAQLLFCVPMPKKTSVVLEPRGGLGRSDFGNGAAQGAGVGVVLTGTHSRCRVSRIRLA